MSTNQLKIEQAIALLQKSTYTVALTGAGISTPSGIPDFRSPNAGIWAHADPLQVATIYAFKQRPQDFYDWIRPLAQIMLTAAPNPAHFALAQLEAHGPLQSVITQNIDLLHTRAGSRVIHEVHGHIREMTCVRCYQIFEAAPFMNELLAEHTVPHCPTCHGVLKPNVILFGEQLPVRILNLAKKEAQRCDLMLVVGTSLEVAPAGDLPHLALQTGARLIIINQGVTFMDDSADILIHDDVAHVLPLLAAPFL